MGQVGGSVLLALHGVDQVLEHIGPQLELLLPQRDDVLLYGVGIVEFSRTCETQGPNVARESLEFRGERAKVDVVSI
jgi:hypothetical protein